MLTHLFFFYGQSNIVKVSASAESLKANPQRGFIVGGVSAGATSTIAISHLYRDEDISPPITGLYLSVPGLLFEAVPERYKHEYTSHLECKDAPIMNTEDLGLLMLGKFPLTMECYF